MQLIHLETQEYPVSVQEFRQRHAHVSFGAEIDYQAFGYAPAFPAPQPAATRLQVAREIAPVLTDKGHYEQTFELVDITADLSQEETAHLTETLKAEQIAQVGSIGWSKETGGITLPDGMKVKTDRESQAQVNAAYTSLRDGFVTEVDFKGANGWGSVTLEEIKPVAQAISQHVQACFKNRRVLEAAISAATTPAKVLAVDLHTGWPN